jgi:beta-lactam-binding protein with PASTA domain
VPLDAVRIADVSRRLARRGLRVASVTGSGDLGATFVEKVAKGLDASEAIVVFWSRDSVDSPWVKAAAEEGLRRGILVPVLLDDVPPPLGFRSVSAADLSRGATPDALDRLCEAVYRIAMGTPGTILAPPAYAPIGGSVPASSPQQAPRLGRLVKLAVAATVVLALVGLGSIGWYLRDTAAPPSDVTPAPDAVTPAPAATPRVTVPDFVGTSSGDVVKTADLIGLTVVMSDGQGAQAAFLDGVVTRQTPAPGASVDRLTRIELEVATQTVSMPTLVGTTLNAALQALDRNRLRLGKTLSQPVADAKPGTIVQQTPEAGEMVAAGTAVDVVVATTPRPAPRRITVPNFVGATSAAAEAEARRLGITLSKVDADGKDARALSGVVIAQVPAPKAQLAAQGTVQIRIAAPATAPPGIAPPGAVPPSTVPQSPAPPATVPPSTVPGTSRGAVAGTVPQLIGLTVDAAREALARVGLRLDNAQRRTIPNATPGTIVAQAPSAGARVRAGAGVTVVVAAPPAN